MIPQNFSFFFFFEKKKAGQSVLFSPIAADDSCRVVPNASSKRGGLFPHAVQFSHAILYSKSRFSIYMFKVKMNHLNPD